MSKLMRHFMRSRFMSSFREIRYTNYPKIKQIKNENHRSITSRMVFPVPVLANLRLLCFAMIAYAESAKDKSKTASTSKNDKVETAQINICDEYFALGKYKESLGAIVEFKESGSVEILWRISRALYNMSKQKGLKSSESSDMVHEAYDVICKAMEIDDKHYAVHKWMAILVDSTSALKGLKARIASLPNFKKHLEIAMELNPKDATSIYMLGHYCYSIAEMPWLQKKIAEALFGKSPTSTFEEALHFFSKAEEAEPNFYSLNLLMLGKTYLKLNRVEPARYWLKCASTYPVRTDEDEMVRKEAEQLLKKHPAPKVTEEKNDEKPKSENDSKSDSVETGQTERQ